MDTGSQQRCKSGFAGTAKKQSTVPESYSNDLTNAVEYQITPAIKWIDRDLPRTFPGYPCFDAQGVKILFSVFLLGIPSATLMLATVWWILYLIIVDGESKISAFS